MRNVLICCFALSVLLPFAARGQQVTVAVSGTLTDPVACEGVVYFGSDNGKLYAVNAADGTAVPGFPVDIKASTGDGVSSYARPGVYYGSLGKAIYLTTAKHGVVKVWANGTVAWFNKLDDTSPIGGLATPAVTPDGEVFAEMKTSNNVYLVKLKESDGSVVNTSAPLATDYFNWVGSPCIVAGNVYVGVRLYPATPGGSLIVLNRADLTVKASTGGIHSNFNIPYVRGGNLYVGGELGLVFKMNAVTLAPDLGFGGYSGNVPGGFAFIGPGGADWTEVGPSPPVADRDPGGTIYAVAWGPDPVDLTTKIHLAAIDVTNGKYRVLVDEVTDNARGLVVNNRSIIGFNEGKYFRQMPVDGGGRSILLPQYPGRPTYDPITGRFFVTTTDRKTNATTYLYGFNSL